MYGIKTIDDLVNKVVVCVDGNKLPRFLEFIKTLEDVTSVEMEGNYRIWIELEKVENDCNLPIGIDVFCDAGCIEGTIKRCIKNGDMQILTVE